jgi:PAS domain S-box-containing protein
VIPGPSGSMPWSPGELGLALNVCCEHALDRRPALPLALRAAGLEVRVCPPGGAAEGSRDPDTLVAIVDDPIDPVEAVRKLRQAAPHAAVLVLTDAPGYRGGDAVLPTSCTDSAIVAVARALARSQATIRQPDDEVRSRMAAIVESAEDAIVSKDLGAIITSWNPGAERMFEYSADEALGHHISLIIPRELWDEEAEILSRIRRGERVSHFETVRRAKSGRLLNVSLAISPVLDGTGKVVGAVKIARDLGAHRKATEVAERLAAIVESSDDAIVSKSLRGVITSWNSGAQRLFGYTAAEAVGRHISLIIPPELWQEEEQILAKLRRGERIDHFETIRRTKDGRLLNISLTVSPVRDASGHIVGASKVARDVTGQRLARERIHRSEERLRLATEVGRVGVWEWDIAQGAVEWSDLLYEIHGVDRSTFVPDPRSFEPLVHEEDRERLAQALRNALKLGEPFQIEIRGVRPGGDVHWLALRAEVLRDEDGRPVRMIGVTTDITDRRRSEAQLRASEASARARAIELEAIMDAAPAIVLMTSDPQCRTIVGNRAAYEALRLPHGSNIATSTPSGNRDGILQVLRNGQRLADPQLPVRRAASGEIVRDEELEVRFEDGSSIWVYGHATPIRHASGEQAGAVGVFVDVTELKRTREELSRRILELARSNSELQDFAYLAGHDLKEPLRGIVAYAQILMDDYGDRLDEDAREKLGALVRLPTRMYGLLDALLEYARLGRIHPDLADLDTGAVVEGAIEMLQAKIAERGAVVTVEHPLPRVRADRLLLEQVLVNLIANGIKYNRAEPPRVQIGATPEAELFVRDNGIGIPGRHHDAIFRMFKRLHPRDAYGGGTGVGLAIVKRIVEMHGGRIRVESGDGSGSTFFLRIPGGKADAAEAAHAGAAHA